MDYLGTSGKVKYPHPLKYAVHFFFFNVTLKIQKDLFIETVTVVDRAVA